MRPLRVYSDTSVIGGYEDPEFTAHSRAFFAYVRQGRMIALISPIVVAELAAAPVTVRAVLGGLSPEMVEYVDVTPQAGALRDAHLEANVVARRWMDDAAHVAVATVARAMPSCRGTSGISSVSTRYERSIK